MVAHDVGSDFICIDFIMTSAEEKLMIEYIIKSRILKDFPRVTDSGDK